jgi:hypothetical protein
MKMGRLIAAKTENNVGLVGDIGPVAGQGCVAAIKDRIIL